MGHDGGLVAVADEPLRLSPVYAVDGDRCFLSDLAPSPIAGAAKPAPTPPPPRPSPGLPGRPGSVKSRPRQPFATLPPAGRHPARAAFLKGDTTMSKRD